ncbi:MAG: type VI secretion system protein TssA [Chthoniobacterales bacterium]|nr:MAG: type VI secretion system protein TssA [Chthoniobacterales bacterium]
MPLREDLLNPIPGENPSGKDLRYDPVYDKIKEARREDDNLAQGDWQRERKIADWPLVVQLAQDAIATRGKDLQIAAWLTEAILKRDGFGGFREGLTLCRGLLEKFWDTLYPALEDGDMEMRAAPIDWIGSKLGTPLKNVPLCKDGYGYWQYKDSRLVGYEEMAKSDNQKSTREQALNEGKLAPEAFDKSFGETPKAFYAKAEKELDGCLAELTALDAVCEEKFTGEAPALGHLKTAIEEARGTVHGLLQKKREAEPDPVAEIKAAPAGVPGDESPSGDGVPSYPPGAGFMLGTQAAVEPPGRAEAIANVVAAAAFLRKREPASPAPYLMLRGLRWGELRAASDPMTLEAPPTEIRRHVKGLAMQGKWLDLLEAAENVMGLPCSRAWLDLQRFVVEACVALGEDYYAIAVAIRSELRALLRDLPALLQATLSDDTPAANAETQTWLRELIEEPSNSPPLPEPIDTPLLDLPRVPGWQKKFVDSHALAVNALRAGQQQKAIDILSRELDRQRTGRGRFQRKLQLAQICISAGKPNIAQPLLDDIAAAIETHKLEEWEDRETVAGALALLIRASTAIQEDDTAKSALFKRVCRLDPVKAMEIA